MDAEVDPDPDSAAEPNQGPVLPVPVAVGTTNANVNQLPKTLSDACRTSRSRQNLLDWRRT
jgi:hypothetical protein